MTLDFDLINISGYLQGYHIACMTKVWLQPNLNISN